MDKLRRKVVAGICWSGWGGHLFGRDHYERRESGGRVWYGFVWREHPW